MCIRDSGSTGRAFDHGGGHELSQARAFDGLLNDAPGDKKLESQNAIVRDGAVDPFQSVGKQPNRRGIGLRGREDSGHKSGSNEIP